jgi:transcriptional antiterminator RfaH
MTAWYVLQTKPRAEAWACEQIVEQGFDTLLPQFHKRHRIRGVLVDVIFPAFPGYAFVKFDAWSDHWEPIASTRGVNRLLCNADGVPRSLPADVARLLVARFGSGPLESLDAAMQVIKAGMHLRVKKGPFENLVGECSWSKAGRVKIMLSLFGTERAIPFEEQDVEIAMGAVTA